MKNKKRYCIHILSILTMIFAFAQGGTVFATSYQKPNQQETIANEISSSKNKEWANRITEDISEALEAMATAETIITQDISTYDSQMSNIADSVKLLSSSLLAIFVIIEILTELNRKGDEFRWEDSVNLIIKLLIIKNVVDISPLVMNAMYNSVNKIILQLGQGSTSLDASLNTSAIAIGKKVMEEIDACKGIFKGIQQSFIYVKFWLNMLAIKICGLLVDVVAFSRIFQILWLKTLSSIPIVFCAWNETKDITKRFALSFFAVCLQGLVISVSFRLYLVVLQQPVISNMSTTIGMLLATLILAKAVMSSGNWAKELLGAA